MQTQTLSGSWQFREAGAAAWSAAIVPGSVHTDLMAHGRIPDPFVADNEKRVQWVAESDWEYRRSFTVDAGLLDEEQVFLVCDGLDTLAEVSLNGVLLGKTANQFRSYRWDVKSLLNQMENQLSILFRSPVRYVTTKQQERPMRNVDQGFAGAPHMRKAPCQFGWDWGPRLPSIGIWKDIRLEGRSLARLDDVHLRQRHVQDTGALNVILEALLKIERWGDFPLAAVVRVTGPDGEVVAERAAIADSEVKLTVTIGRPQLWWPSGYGSHPLYGVDVLLLSGQEIVDQRRYEIGLREIELRQEPDQWGRSFAFVVNGVPIFAKGSNWIPADSFVTRISDQHLEYLIASAARSNQNMLRVWGGGLYEEERFYDLCDRYGILVWQDMVFSCAIYPLDEADFHANVQAEVEENVRRIRHRASLALWCGNNEMEEGWVHWGWAKHELEDQLPDLVEQYPALRFLLEAAKGRTLLPDWAELKEAYDRFFHASLPAWINALDPDTPYWPSSPSTGTPFHDTTSQAQGDAHYWEVWHDRKPFTAYRETCPRFMSEFGFQSLPPLETIRSYADEADWNMTSYVMEHHQRGNHGNGLIISQMTDSFRMPKDFNSLVYLSMVLQAEGIRYGVEHWRRHMERISGTLYWQLNDCWPVASWSSIDYFGRWKALHYAARRFYAPRLLSIEDSPPQMNVFVSSDLTESWNGSVRWSLESLDGERLDGGEEEVLARPLSSTEVCRLDFGAQIGDDNERERVFVCELWTDSRKQATQIATFVPNKHLYLSDPRLQVNLLDIPEGVQITVASRSLARFVELSLEGADVEFSDNYFDLPAGRTAVVTASLPEGWSLDEARRALRARSLYDSFA